MFSKCEGHAFLDTKDQFNPSQCMKIHPDQFMTVTFLNTNEYPNNFQQMCVYTGESHTVVLSCCGFVFCNFSYSRSTTVGKY